MQRIKKITEVEIESVIGFNGDEPEIQCQVVELINVRSSDIDMIRRALTRVLGKQKMKMTRVVNVRPSVVYKYVMSDEDFEKYATCVPIICNEEE